MRSIFITLIALFIFTSFAFSQMQDMMMNASEDTQTNSTSTQPKNTTSPDSSSKKKKGKKGEGRKKGGQTVDAKSDMRQANRAAKQDEKKLLNSEKKGEQKKVNLDEGSPFEVKSDAFICTTKIDEIVLEGLKKHNLKPAKLCSDAVFLRRIYLDLTGTIPTPEEVKKFLEDKSEKKREELVDSLLASKECVEYFTMKFADTMRIKAEFPINLWPNAAQAYNRYVSKSLAENVPYDVFVRKMLVSTGSNFREGEVNFYRAMQSRTPDSVASCVALTFMGMRYEKLSPEKQKNMAAFFDRMAYKSTKEWKEEIVFCDPTKRAPFVGILPDSKMVSLDANQDPRVSFADWLVAKGNPYFSRAFANKMWTWLLGTEIVTPADDMFISNLPQNPMLLDCLAKEFEDLNFDIKKFIRFIVLSRTYQQSTIPQSEPIQTRKNFGVYGVRQLDAEVLIDAICKLSGTSEIYSSTTPEPYTMLPEYEKAVSLPDGSITTSFLELFGKAPRDTGLINEKTLAPSASQRLHLVNSSHIRRKIESGPNLHKIYRLGHIKCIDMLYLSILARYPTEAEKTAYMEYKYDMKNWTWFKMIDTAWALVNSEEFINRH